MKSPSELAEEYSVKVFEDCIQSIEDMPSQGFLAGFLAGYRAALTQAVGICRMFEELSLDNADHSDAKIADSIGIELKQLLEEG